MKLKAIAKLTESEVEWYNTHYDNFFKSIAYAFPKVQHIVIKYKVKDTQNTYMLELIY